MFPIHDDNPTRRLPILTLLLIALNVGIFAYQSSLPKVADNLSATTLGGTQEQIICEWATIPDRTLDGDAPERDPCLDANREQARPVGLVTHQFIHGSWLHLIGNMLFLWVFGNNIEDRLGRLRFLPFYLLCGVIAALVQALTTPTSTVPLIGASGAISGVVGAYLLLFPRARILALPVPFRLPAWLVIGGWIAFQFFYASGETKGGEEGGVAYWAHVAGFVAGLVLILPFLTGRRRAPQASRRQS